MIYCLGHDYKVKLNICAEIKVTGHGEEDAENNAIKAVEEALSEICSAVDAEVVEMERGEEALDVTEDE